MQSQYNNAQVYECPFRGLAVAMELNDGANRNIINIYPYTILIYRVV